MRCLAFIFLLAGLSSCGTIRYTRFNLEEANKARAGKQVYVEDSSVVFFSDYPNPFYDRSFLSFWSFMEGGVELEVFDALTDTLEATYVFTKKATHNYNLSFRAEGQTGTVKCVIRIGGREKCSRVYDRWKSTLDRQGEYTVRRE